MSRCDLASPIDALLRPPTRSEVETALAQFAARVRDHYGDRLKGLYLFGSRARGDHRPDSDADVAVILQDDGWTGWQERRTLNWLAYDPSLDSGLAIQAWPFSEEQWTRSDRRSTSPLIEAARREAEPLDDTKEHAAREVAR
jgi:predicted nucleotidyltransferase